MRFIPIDERPEEEAKLKVSTPAPAGAAKSRPASARSSENKAEDKGTSGIRKPRGIARVPTHTVGHARERRAYARANLSLPLFVRSIAGSPAPGLTALSTHDISSSGIFFLSPRHVEPGTLIEMEVTLVDKPVGRGTVRMRARASVVRVEGSKTPGWHGLAAAFDEITFVRDEPFPAS
jgi:hypothetical protein